MEEYKKEKLMVSAILFKNNVPVEEAKPIGTYIEKLIKENQQLKDKQKQFAKYLEDIIDVYKEIDREFILSNKKRETKICKEILQEYREIIGGDNNE